MKRHRKQEVLMQIYAAYDDFIGSEYTACEKKCAACCTRNVVLTGLEASAIVNGIKRADRTGMFDAIRQHVNKKRFIPRITTNGIAARCMAGKDLPEEESDPAWSPCPLLKNNLCAIYSQRPFGCRCMVSEKKCQETGYAKMSDYVLTVNHVFGQVIENVDKDGRTGNLIDMLLFLESEDRQASYDQNVWKENGNGLIHNQAMTVLMIPPEHQSKIQPILRVLRDIRG